MRRVILVGLTALVLTACGKVNTAETKTFKVMDIGKHNGHREAIIRYNDELRSVDITGYDVKKGDEITVEITESTAILEGK
jgi:hypothetical protein